jgi:hypothetical protein
MVFCFSLSQTEIEKSFLQTLEILQKKVRTLGKENIVTCLPS